MKKAEEKIRSIFPGLKKKPKTLQAESMTKTLSGQDFKWRSSAVLSEYLQKHLSSCFASVALGTGKIVSAMKLPKMKQLLCH